MGLNRTYYHILLFTFFSVAARTFKTPCGSHDLDSSVLGLLIITFSVDQLRLTTLVGTTFGEWVLCVCVCFFPSLAFQGSEWILLQISFYDPGPWDPSRSRRRQEERGGLLEG